MSLSRQHPRSPRPLLLPLALAVALAMPLPALAGPSPEASDRVWEAADAIDAARAEAQAGRAEEARRLLALAEGLLSEAERLDPGLARISYERARVHLARHDALLAQAELVAAMRLDLAIDEHVRMAGLLDEARAALGRPELAVRWQRDTALRGAGLGALSAGAALAGVGMAVAWLSFAHAAGGGVTEQDRAANRLGWGLVGTGGGVLVAGGALTIAGEIRLGEQRAILPGPWRLSSLPADASVVVAVRWKTR